jgi:hypothetical protein
MLAVYHKRISRLRSKLDNEIHVVVKILTEIIISWTVNIPELYHNEYVMQWDKYCKICIKNMVNFTIKYHKQPPIYGELMICSDYNDNLIDELHNTMDEFVYKLFLSKEISVISDIKLYIFKLYNQLCREIEL